MSNASSQELLDDLTFNDNEVEVLEVEVPIADGQPRPVVACETVQK